MLRPCGFLPTLGEYDSRAEAHAAQYLAARGVVSVADLSPAETAAFVSEMRGRSFEIHHGALEALVAEHRAERRLRGGGSADSATPFPSLRVATRSVASYSVRLCNFHASWWPQKSGPLGPMRIGRHFSRAWGDTYHSSGRI